MSLRISASNQIAGYRGVALAQDSFARVVRVRLDGAQPDFRSILSFFTSAGEVHELYTNPAGTAWTLGRSYSAGQVALQDLGQSQSPGAWYDIGIVGLSVSSAPKLRAYVKPIGAAAAREYELDNPSTGSIVGAFLGSPIVGFSAIATFSNSKTFNVSKTKAQIEAEMNSKAVVNATGLVEYNDLIGQDLAGVMTADTGAVPWALMVSLDGPGTAGQSPTRSTDEPSWPVAVTGWYALVEQPYADVTPGEWVPGFALGAKYVSDGTSQTFRYTHGSSSSSAMLLAFEVADWAATGTVRGTAAAALQTGTRLAAAGNVSGVATAAMTSAPRLSCAAAAAVNGSAALTTEIRLAGSAAAAVAGAANPTFPGNTFLNAEGEVTGEATAGLVAQPLLRAAAGAFVAGSADLTKPVPLEASGLIESSSIATFDNPYSGLIRMSVTHRRIQMTAT